MDLMMPKKDGVAATAEITEKSPAAKVILLTTFGTSDGISHALQAGAKGAILKNADNNQLASAIRKVAAGGRVIASEISKTLRIDPPVTDLTPRQLEILQSVTRGLTNEDIAKQFGITSSGVKQHLSAVFAKLGASSRSEAVAIALRKQLLKA